MDPKLHRIPPSQTGRARQLRRESTFPERLLWSRLRAGRLGDMKFRRQHAIGPFIVDFYCAETSLVIEVDGMSHVGRGESDEMRTGYLESHGLQVVRYTNDDVLRDVDAVAEDIARRVGIAQSCRSHPPLTPPSKGGGSSQASL